MKKLTDDQIEKMKLLPSLFSDKFVAKKSKKAKMDPEDEEDPEECIVEIDMLRTGKFLRASWFGEYILNINPEMLNFMVKNFNNKIIERGVALDLDHEGAYGHTGAYGWLVELNTESREVKGKTQTFLIGKWSLTAKGKEIVEGGVYKLFSIEFQHNYKDREVTETSISPDGDETAIGSRMSYGPTITGGALTNRPFIPTMNEVKLSEADAQFSEKSNVCFLVEMPEKPQKNASSVPAKPVLTLSENSDQTTIDDGKPAHKSRGVIDLLSNYQPPKETNMKLTATTSMLASMKSQLEKMDKNSPDYANFAESISACEKEIAEGTNALSEKDQALANLTTKVGELTTKVVQGENQLNEVSTELSLQRERTRQNNVSTYSASLISAGYTKPVANKVKELLTGDVENKSVLTLTNDKGEKRSLSIKDVIAEVLSVVPADAKVPVGEGLVFDIGSHVNADGELSQTSDATTKFLEDNADAINSGTSKGLKNLKKPKSA